MTAIATSTRAALRQSDKPALFQVWIDVNCDVTPAPDWWWDSPPKPLAEALQDAHDARSSAWTCVVLPEGQNPRPDGRWDNPV